jgi:hypothetical protein
VYNYEYKELFNFIEEYYMDDFITEVRVGSDLRKATEKAHNLCYKVRKILSINTFKNLV